MKVSELEGPLLREWVARANDWKIERDGDHEDAMLICWDEKGEPFSFGEFGYCPDKNWAHGGPILDSMIATGFNIASNDRLVECSNMDDDGNVRSDAIERIIFESGETTLIAVCRAKVASVYGDEVPDDPS